MRFNPRGFGRFLRNFFTHPGTWVLLALLAVGIGFALPFVAPALVIFAAVAIGFAAIATPFYLLSNAINYVSKCVNYKYKVKQNSQDESDKVIKAAFITIKDWAEVHPVQAIIVGVGLAVLITALVLTIGFFSGGAAFAFMAPVFATIAAPFATAAAAAGVQLGLAALAGTIFILAALNITNIFKRLASWFDSFIYDYAADQKTHKENTPSESNLAWQTKAWTWREVRKDQALTHFVFNETHGIGYFPAVLRGIAVTIENGFASVDEDKLLGNLPLRIPTPTGM